MAAIAFIFIGLFVGFFAGAIARGRSTMSMSMCVGLGILGALLGGYAVVLLSRNDTVAATGANAMGAVVGAVLLNAAMYGLKTERVR